MYLAHIESQPKKVMKNSFVYSPIYRDTEYLSQFLKDEEGAVSASGDKLVYYGKTEDIARVKSVLKGVDVPSREVVVTGYVLKYKQKKKGKWN